MTREEFAIKWGNSYEPDQSRFFDCSDRLKEDLKEMLNAESQREAFAAAALTGILSNADTMRELTRRYESSEIRGGKEEDEFSDVIADLAYMYADSMVKRK